MAADGIEALAVIRGSGDEPALARPYVVILDLNMPRMNGLEFLRELRSDKAFAATTVFVLSTSGADADLEAAYSHQIAGYIQKDRAGLEFLGLIDMLDSYWRVVTLPER